MRALILGELVGLLVAYLAFLALYLARSRAVPWWRSPWSRMVVYVHASVAALLGNSLLLWAWPREPYRQQVVATLMGGMLLGALWQLRRLISTMVGPVDPGVDEVERSQRRVGDTPERGKTRSW